MVSVVVVAPETVLLLLTFALFFCHWKLVALVRGDRERRVGAGGDDGVHRLHGDDGLVGDGDVEDSERSRARAAGAG